MTPERQSTKHGPQLDDELADEVEPLTEGAPVDGRAREDREPEPAADGEPEPRVHDEFNERSEVARHLAPAWFPADREALVDAAIAEAAPVAVIDALNALPDDQIFENPARAWEAITGHRETRG